MTEQYTPDEETVREQYSREQPPHIGTVGEKRAEFDRFLARVRRDAAANALYEVATDIDNYDDYVMVHNRAKRIEENR